MRFLGPHAGLRRSVLELGGKKELEPWTGMWAGLYPFSSTLFCRSALILPSSHLTKPRHSTNAHWRRLLCQARGERQTGQTCSSLFLTDISLLPWSMFSPCRDRHIAPWFHLSPTLATRGATQWNSLPKSTSLDQKALGRQPKAPWQASPPIFLHISLHSI